MHQNFLDLYDQYFDDIYRYIYFKTGNQWDCDDLVSDTFRKAYEKYRTLNKSPKAWLFAIARNSVTDFYRKKKDIAVGDDLELYAYPLRFEENLEEKEELNCLKKSLSILSKEELEVINLKYFSGLKYEEIGILLGRTEDSVKMKSSRIIKKLKIIVSNCMEGSK